VSNGRSIRGQKYLFCYLSFRCLAGKQDCRGGACIAAARQMQLPGYSGVPLPCSMHQVRRDQQQRGIARGESGACTAQNFIIDCLVMACTVNVLLQSIEPDPVDSSKHHYHRVMRVPDGACGPVVWPGVSTSIREAPSHASIARLRTAPQRYSPITPVSRITR